METTGSLYVDTSRKPTVPIAFSISFPKVKCNGKYNIVLHIYLHNLHLRLNFWKLKKKIRYARLLSNQTMTIYAQ